MSFRTTALLGMTALLVAGCASAVSPSEGQSAGASQPVATTQASGTNTIPPGRYLAELPAGLEGAPGLWQMDITPEAVTWTSPEGNSFSPGDLVEVTATRIVFAPDPECPDQAGEPTEGTYEWSVDGGQLSFTLVSDSCAGRRDTLTAVPWEPVG
jgi:hypothetical protein